MGHSYIGGVGHSSFNDCEQCSFRLPKEEVKQCGAVYINNTAKAPIMTIGAFAEIYECLYLTFWGMFTLGVFYKLQNLL